MDQYYSKPNLSITTAFRTPKAGNFRQGFSFEKAGVPGTSTHYSQMNKENQAVGITMQKSTDFQARRQPEGFSKGPTFEKKSYNFDSYGTNLGQQPSFHTNYYAPMKLPQTSSGISQPLLVSHDPNTFTATRAREENQLMGQTMQFSRNPPRVMGSYAEKQNYDQESRNGRVLTEEDTNANYRGFEANSRTGVYSSLSFGSPKNQAITPELLQNPNSRKMPQRSSYDFATRELMQANSVKTISKRPESQQPESQRALYQQEDANSTSRKAFLQSRDYPHTKATSVDRVKKLQDTSYYSKEGSDSQYSMNFSQVESSFQRNAEPVYPSQGTASMFGSPKYTSERVFKFEKVMSPSTQAQERMRNQSTEGTSNAKPENLRFDVRASGSNKTMSEKLEEYSNTLKRLEERIAKSKSELREDIQTSSHHHPPTLMNNFFSDARQKNILTQTQAASPKASALDSYDNLGRTYQPNQFRPQQYQPQDIQEKARAVKPSTPSAKHSDSPAQKPLISFSEKEYLEYLKNRNTPSAARTTNSESTTETRTNAARVSTLQTRADSAKLKKSESTPNNINHHPQATNHKSLKDFVTQVGPGSNLPLTSQNQPGNFDEKEETSKYNTNRLSLQSTKNSTISTRYNETIGAQTTKNKENDAKIFVFNHTRNRVNKNKENNQSQSSFIVESAQSRESEIVALRQRLVPSYYMQGLERHFREPDTNDYFCKIYREHFFQSFQAMNFCKNLKDVDPKELNKRKVHLPRLDRHKDKKTIVFDLDETLIHCNENTSIPSDVILPIKFPSGDIIEAGINVRPYARECLEELSKHFEIFVFTASHACYANVVLDYLDPENKLIQHRLFRDSCIQTAEGLYVKDLRVFANRNLKDLVLVDNAVYSFGYQIENGIPITPFYYHKSDFELKSLVAYLKSLASARDVREVNRNTFKLHLYPNFNGAEDLINKLFE